MTRWSVRLLSVVFCVFAFPYRSPAPLVFRPAKGGLTRSRRNGAWVRTRAKDQLEVAQQAFDAKNYSLANKAAKRTVNQWPFSDYAPQAQYLDRPLLRSEGTGQNRVQALQTLIEKYPKIESTEVLRRQYEIANRFLDGQWDKLWGISRFLHRWTRRRICSRRS
jgi:hypothetical protein